MLLALQLATCLQEVRDLVHHNMDQTPYCYGIFLNALRQLLGACKEGDVLGKASSWLMWSREQDFSPENKSKLSTLDLAVAASSVQLI